MAGGGRNDIFEITISAASLWRASGSAYHHVLQQCVHPFDLYIRAAGQMCCLLQEHVLRSEDLADVYCDFLRIAYGQRRCRCRVHRNQKTLTSFCAENMEFIIGIYVEDWSGETESTRIRGSIDVAPPSAPWVEAVGAERVLLMSTEVFAHAHGRFPELQMKTHSIVPW